ncbi:hypothetical protein ScPMuIL_010466 [Solemya velum]
MSTGTPDKLTPLDETDKTSLIDEVTSEDFPDESADTVEDEPLGPLGERKFGVSESKLLELFTVCSSCSGATNGSIKQILGTMVKIETECGFCRTIRKWDSQPMVGSIPAGNLALSAGILFTGSISAKALRMLEFMRVCHTSKATFILHQRNILYPAVERVWQNHQRKYVEKAKRSGKTLALGGDGRSDTPGHCAKYGSYSMVDLDEGLVVDIQLIQSNEVKHSVNMEKEGLIRCVDWLKSEELDVSTVVTDRNMQIQKWIRENMSTTKHYYDVWHVAKVLKKKLLALSKTKDCEDVLGWIKSISNHLYWCAVSTPTGDGDVMWAKWLSVCSHIQNIHNGHDDLFPSCLHDGLTSREIKKKKWLHAGTKSCEKISDILTTVQMKKDVHKLSPKYQTSGIEAFHSTVNHFAPKMIGFSFHGMFCSSCGQRNSDVSAKKSPAPSYKLSVGSISVFPEMFGKLSIILSLL